MGCNTRAMLELACAGDPRVSELPGETNESRHDVAGTETPRDREKNCRVNYTARQE